MYKKKRRKKESLNKMLKKQSGKNYATASSYLS